MIIMSNIDKKEQETQNIEFKETWRDEYIKWICGFANAQGGTLIANAFFRLGFIESWGRGFEKINEESKHAGNPLPILSYDSSGLMIEFKPIIRETPVETPVEKSIKTPVLIMRILRDNPKLTLIEVSKKVDKSIRAVERAIAQLVKDGYIEHIGSKKSGSWVIKKDIRP
jgi:ATP-dependent DNA helicase RecG